MGIISNKLEELGIVIPQAPVPVASYVSVIRLGNVIVTSGQLPWQGDALIHQGRRSAIHVLANGLAAAGAAGDPRDGRRGGRLGASSQALLARPGCLLSAAARSARWVCYCGMKLCARSTL